MDKEKEAFGSAYLYAEDLIAGGVFRKVEVTIAKLHPPGTLQRADKKMIDKPALEFEGKKKLLVFGKTNGCLLIYATGETDSEKWIGKKITLVVRLVDAFGDKVPAIRVLPACAVRRGLKKLMGEEIK